MNDWVYLDGFVDPPPPPTGYKTEVKYCEPMGFVYAYRYIPNKKEPINE